MTPRFRLPKRGMTRFLRHRKEGEQLIDYARHQVDVIRYLEARLAGCERAMTSEVRAYRAREARA